jgi:hypothetical protein
MVFDLLIVFIQRAAFVGGSAVLKTMSVAGGGQNQRQPHPCNAADNAFHLAIRAATFMTHGDRVHQSATGEKLQEFSPFRRYRNGETAGARWAFSKYRHAAFDRSVFWKPQRNLFGKEKIREIITLDGQTVSRFGREMRNVHKLILPSWRRFWGRGGADRRR